jgi:hypothetical protein
MTVSRQSDAYNLRASRLPSTNELAYGDTNLIVSIPNRLYVLFNLTNVVFCFSVTARRWKKAPMSKLNCEAVDHLTFQQHQGLHL